jgi:hypothetical protein
MQIPITPDLERRLLDLLSTSASSTGEIDFVHLTDLVGLSFQPLQNQEMVATLNQRPPLASTLAEQNRKFFRILFQSLDLQAV